MQTTSKPKTDEPKIRYGKCEQCAMRTPLTELFIVRDMKVCERCGEQEIKTWNNYVKELEEVRS